MDRKTVADVATDVIAATVVVAGAGIAVALCFALLTALVAISSPGNPVAVAFGWVLYVGMGVLIRPWGLPVLGAVAVGAAVWWTVRRRRGRRHATT